MATRNAEFDNTRTTGFILIWVDASFCSSVAEDKGHAKAEDVIGLDLAAVPISNAIWRIVGQSFCRFEGRGAPARRNLFDVIST